MLSSIRSTVLLAAMFALAGLTAWSQARSQAEGKPPSLQVAVLYSSLGANTITGDGFWAQGVTFQPEQHLLRGVSAIADISITHTGSMQSSGVGLSLLTTTFGPRYTWYGPRGASLYGHALVGRAFGMDSVFPAPGAASTSAGSVAYGFGGGANYKLRPRITLRVLEVGWVHTELPNLTTNVQNDLRFSAGAVLRLR